MWVWVTRAQAVSLLLLAFLLALLAAAATVPKVQVLQVLLYGCKVLPMDYKPTVLLLF